MYVVLGTVSACTMYLELLNGVNLFWGTFVTFGSWSPLTISYSLPSSIDSSMEFVAMSPHGNLIWHIQ